MWVPAVLGAVVGLAAGCGAQPSPAPASSVAVVPSGCVPTVGAVQWSGVEDAPVLEHVTLFAGRADGTGTELLAKPVAASVAGLDAPTAWVPLLATDLGNKLDRKVSTTRPSSSYGTSFPGVSDLDPSIPETVVYQGVRRVSAAFSVDCRPAVGGVFTAWTEEVSGGVMCGASEAPTDPYAQAARGYCPRTPAPGVSAG